MKKILCILLAAMLVLSVIACAPNAEQVETIESDPLFMELLQNIVAIATRAILLLLLCFLAKIGLPLLEKFGLMWIVRICVKAAEKQGETGAIDKAQKKTARSAFTRIVRDFKNTVDRKHDRGSCRRD